MDLPPGFAASGAHAGIKASGASDLGLLSADEARPAQAVFTRNRLLGAHVPVCREHLERSGGLVRAILVNSGNANCATGQRGLDDARALCAAVGDALGCPQEQVLCVSTGVIGAHLPLERMLAAVPALVGMDADIDAFARAIMTTDTEPKVVGQDGVVGVAKGAGMIHPDLATMLAFLLADGTADLPSIVEQSFHRLSIDGDTSPNDTVVLWSGGSRDVSATAIAVSQELCRKIARDGEGATRLVTIAVTGAASADDAVHVGRLIATSPLCKTAVTGRDPNWGRVLSVGGRAGVPIEVSRARVTIGDAIVFSDGEPRVEGEADAHRHLAECSEVTIGIDLGVGSGAAEVWTCDLTKDYVTINAEYRT